MSPAYASQSRRHNSHTIAVSLTGKGAVRFQDPNTTTRSIIQEDDARDALQLDPTKVLHRPRYCRRQVCFYSHEPARKKELSFPRCPYKKTPSRTSAASVR